MTILAALLMLVGTGCHLENPKGICANGVWITSILTATAITLAARDQFKVLYYVAIFIATILILFAAIGALKLLNEIKNWLED